MGEKAGAEKTKAGGGRRLLLQGRHLEGGATSTSSSPTQEEVAESDQASGEDYTGAEIKAPTTTTAPSPATTPETIVADDGESDMLGSSVTAGHHVAVVTAAISFCAAL